METEPVHSLPIREKLRNIVLSATLATGMAAPPVFPQQSCEYTVKTSHIQEHTAPTALGLTFGSIAAEFNNLNPNQTLETLLNKELPYTSFVRLAAYMDQPTNAILSELRQQIAIAEKNHAEVILTVGGKAPHYPEWYINPSDSKDEVAKAEAVLEAFGNNPTVKYFQLSNEPFHSDWRTPPENEQVLQTIHDEMEAYGKKIIVTHLVEPNVFDEAGFRKAAAYGDIIGLDIYTQVGLSHATCESLIKTLRQYKSLADSLHKPLWVTESQTKPWEPAPLPFHIPEFLYLPFQPQDIFFLYQAELLTLHPEVILEFDTVTDYKQALDGNPKTLNVLKRLGQIRTTETQKVQEERAKDQNIIVSFPNGRSTTHLILNASK